jgi:hypothetical protein
MNGTYSTGSNDPGSYPYLRQVLAPQFAMLPTEALEGFMDERFGEGSAQQYDEYLEGFLDDVGKFFAKAAPIVGNVAGGVVRGAMSGSSLGLPGIIAGAVAGGAGTALSSYGKGPLKDVGQALSSGVQVASQLTPMGQMGNQIGGAVSGVSKAGFTPNSFATQGVQLLQGGLAQLGGGAGSKLAGAGGAAGTLFSMLGRPEVQQALTALNLGSAGRQTVPVGQAQTPVPTSAIAGLLQSLLGRAASEAAAESDGAESEMQYMLDDRGLLVGDPALERDRVQRVMDLLDQAHIDRLTAAAIREALLQAQAAHVVDCPQCGFGARRPRYATAPLQEDYLEAFEEDYSEYDAEQDEAFEEDFGEDFGEDAADAIIARANWEMPRVYS